MATRVQTPPIPAHHRRLLVAPLLLITAVLFAFAATPALAAPVPAVTGVAPSSGPASGGNTVVLTGTDFSGATSVLFGTTGASFITNSATQITAIAPPGAAGVVNVHVTTADGTSTGAPGNQYSYTAALPQVTGLNPTSGPIGGGNTVTLTGSGFTGTTAVMFGSAGASFIVISDSQINAVAPAIVGSQSVNVRVMTGAGTSGPSAANLYTYGAVQYGPIITSLSPSSGAVSGGTNVVITGSGFTNATSVTFANVSVPFSVNSDSQIVALAPPASGPGTVNVRVTTPSGTSVANGASVFTYTSVGSAVSVTGLSPTSGAAAGGTTVTITGSGFTGATQVLFGTAGAAFTVNSDSQITAIAPPGSGSVYVRVVSPNGTSPASPSNLYGYLAAAVPNVTSISPSSGPTTGGTVVVVRGSGFTGATSVLFGPDPGAFTVNSDTLITVTSPARPAGPVGIGVYGPGGVSPNTAADDYTYVQSGPPPPNFCPLYPFWVDDLAYGSPGGGFYWDPVSNQVWTAQRGWHYFSPFPARPFPLPLWIDALGYGSAGGGFYWDPVSGQVWTAERGWHLYSPQRCVAR